MPRFERAMELIDLAIWTLNDIKNTGVRENPYGFRNTYEVVAHLTKERQKLSKT